MNPAWSVVLLTTLTGTGQGLFVLLVAAELAGAVPRGLLAAGAALAALFTLAGLVASVFHLGRPERAWRAATMWRSSWLSREVIALPLFLAGLVVWGAGHALGAPLPGGRSASLALGALTLAACAALWVCTAMVYASLRFIREWASGYTLLNLPLLGLASGATLATALATLAGPPALRQAFAWAAIALTLAGALGRVAALRRNAALRPVSTLQTAIGIRHPVIRQRAMGFMGGSFNTREFFHGRTPDALRRIRSAFLVGAFALPLGLLAVVAAQGQADGATGPTGVSAATAGAAVAAVAALLVQQLGLVAERWYFLAEARHPQNLYYQTVS